MIHEIYEALGEIFLLIGTFYAIMDKIPFLNKVIEKIYPFKQINKGIAKMTHKTIDEKAEDIFLVNSDEGFKEILYIINQKFGPYPDEIDGICFEYVHKQRTVNTSTFNVVLVRYNNDNFYPTTKRDLLLWIDAWKERFLIVNGFYIIILGTFFRILSIIFQQLSRAPSPC